MSVLPNNALPETAFKRGRWVAWLPWIVSLAITGGAFLWGASAYDSISDPVPVHWGASGEVDEWAPKSFASVYMGPLIGLGIWALLARIIALVVKTSFRAPKTDFARIQKEGLKREIIAGLGGIVLVTSLLVCVPLGVVISSAQSGSSSIGTSMLPWMILLTFLTLPAMFLGFLYGKRWMQKSIREYGVIPTAEEQLEESKWIAGGIRDDPHDPSIFVPKREGLGYGLTVNWGSRGGKIFLLIFAALTVIPLVVLLVISLVG